MVFSLIGRFHQLEIIKIAASKISLDLGKEFNNDFQTITDRMEFSTYGIHAAENKNCLLH